MHQYDDLMLNVLVEYQRQVEQVQKAVQDGIQMDKSEKFKAMAKEIKIQKGYERTIKMVILSGWQDCSPDSNTHFSIMLKSTIIIIRRTW